MEEGIAIAQRSTLVWIDVEFAKGEEPEITDDKTNSSIAERLVTVMLSCLVAKLLLQGKLVRGNKLSKILLEDNLLAHELRRRWGGGQTRERAKQQELGGQGICAVTDGRKAEATTASKRRRDRRMRQRDKWRAVERGVRLFFANWKIDSPRESHEAERIGIFL